MLAAVPFCAVCREAFDLIHDNIVCLPCSHVFHHACIKDGYAAHGCPRCKRRAPSHDSTFLFRQIKFDVEDEDNNKTTVKSPIRGQRAFGGREAQQVAPLIDFDPRYDDSIVGHNNSCQAAPTFQFADTSLAAYHDALHQQYESKHMTAGINGGVSAMQPPQVFSNYHEQADAEYGYDAVGNGAEQWDHNYEITMTNGFHVVDANEVPVVDEAYSGFNQIGPFELNTSYAPIVQSSDSLTLSPNLDLLSLKGPPPPNAQLVGYYVESVGDVSLTTDQLEASGNGGLLLNATPPHTTTPQLPERKRQPLAIIDPETGENCCPPTPPSSDPREKRKSVLKIINPETGMDVLKQTD